jgi:hypothetical protein
MLADDEQAGFDKRRAFAIFRALVRGGFAYGAAGVWLDVFTIRCGCIHSERWNSEHAGAFIRHEQQAAELSCLLRRMSRMLRKSKAHTADAACRDYERLAGPLALKEIACQSAAFIAQIKADNHPAWPETLDVLKDTLLDEDEELLGQWLKHSAAAALEHTERRAQQ